MGATSKRSTVGERHAGREPMVPWSALASGERRASAAFVEVHGDNLHAQEQRLHRVVAPRALANRLGADPVDLVGCAPRLPRRTPACHHQAGRRALRCSGRPVLELADRDNLHAAKFLGSTPLYSGGHSVRSGQSLRQRAYAVFDAIQHVCLSAALLIFLHLAFLAS